MDKIPQEVTAKAFGLAKWAYAHTAMIDEEVDIIEPLASEIAKVWGADLEKAKARHSFKQWLYHVCDEAARAAMGEEFEEWGKRTGVPLMSSDELFFELCAVRDGEISSIITNRDHATDANIEAVKAFWDRWEEMEEAMGEREPAREFHQVTCEEAARRIGIEPEDFGEATHIYMNAECLHFTRDLAKDGFGYLVTIENESEIVPRFHDAVYAVEQWALDEFGE